MVFARGLNEFYLADQNNSKHMALNQQNELINAKYVKYPIIEFELTQTINFVINSGNQSVDISIVAMKVACDFVNTLDYKNLHQI